MYKNINLTGEIYNLNERYVYVENKEHGIKARINRNYLPNITSDNFLNDFENLPKIRFGYREDKKTDSGIHIGYIDKNDLKKEWESVFLKNEIYEFNIIYFDSSCFKIQYNENIYQQNFSEGYSALKIQIIATLEHGIELVELKYSHWLDNENKPYFSYPYENEYNQNEKIKCKLFYVRSQYIKKQQILNDIFYYKDVNKAMHRVTRSDFYDYSKHLKIGDETNLIVTEFNVFEKISISQFEEDTFINKNLKKYEKGDEITAKVFFISPGMVRCVTEDEEVFYIRKQTILKDEKLNITNLLSPGDEIIVSYESELVDNFESKYKSRKFNFLKLENRIFESKNLKDVLDLKASYTKGVSGGYSRTSDFRDLVLEYFNHKCALCDDFLIYNKYSCGEAAHIVPRSSRGVNKIENALCLCKEHHWSFDRGFWTVGENGIINLSTTMLKDNNFKERYEKYSGKQIDEKVNNKINPDAIEWHRRNIFKD